MVLKIKVGFEKLKKEVGNNTGRAKSPLREEESPQHNLTHLGMHSHHFILSLEKTERKIRKS